MALVYVFIFFTTFFSLLTPNGVVVNGLGLASTTAIVYGTSTICGIVANHRTQFIQCYQNNRTILVQPSVSFEAISGGKTFFCGLRSGGFSLFCWDTSSVSFNPRRIYHSNDVRLTDLTVGDDQVCAREVNSSIVRCWRGGALFHSPGEALKFKSVTSGSGFSCGILMDGSRVLCWGNGIGAEIQRGFENMSMSSLIAGESHACGSRKSGTWVCKGNNDSGQLNVPYGASFFMFSGLALGANFTCAIRQSNGYIVCWGHNVFVGNVSFESIVAGLNFVCGLTRSNLSVICWGPGWSSSGNHVTLGSIIPGPCVQTSCSRCGLYPNSDTLCGGSGNICNSCQAELPVVVPLLPRSPLEQGSSPSIGRNKLLLTFMIVGSIGGFAGFCTIIFCIWIRLCSSWFNSPESEQLISAADRNFGAAVEIQTVPGAPSQHLRSSSSSKHAYKTEEFLLAELSAATKHFSIQNKIGDGSFGIVYRGKLSDGREVAIKRADTSTKTKKFQEKRSAFDSELALLSRLHHKHLVKLVGSCEDKDERLLVYEYMSNGSLHDHLHNKKNVEKNSSIVNSWRTRMRIALDAARGIEYLHTYAVPPIIHRDIKSSNILLDADMTTRVSDFGLSLLGPASDQEIMSSKAVGTVGYIDPEYYILNVLTAKSDVYGFGVVLLELLTGKKAVFNDSEEGTDLIGLVEYSGTRIMAGELQSLLDKRVGQLEPNEVEALQLVAYTAMHCVNLEGKERPGMTDIVANLERAVALSEQEPS
ncbi:putative serine/threonine-protein kinase-like protein CCR3 [Argentina anserina]|uniref:putative serine/threonine-protein kinase-like protein CCR3 n=1 Tax=Argentina anserina TaxID=57926 RepID=UPI0021765D27|nr:putative serine/threonine-protein kinase-like protein CCR3 [Potentilla anserina]